MQALPETLLERLKNRQAILVTGLRCAELAQLPGWSALGERLVDWIENEPDKELVRGLLGQGQVGAAVAYVRDLLHEQVLVEALREAYPVTASVPDAIGAVARAPWRGIVTTGLDALWATALAGDPEVGKRTVFAASATTLEVGRGRFLLQLFGRADVPASLCLSPAEIPAKLVATGAAGYLAGLHQRLSFVFVGYGLSDPDLAMLAGHVLGAAPSGVPHFFVAPALSEQDGRLARATLGLQPVSLGSRLEETLQALTEAASQAGSKPADDEVESWLEILAGDPDSDEAHAALDRGSARLRENQEWERLVGVLVSRVEHLREPAAQAALLRDAGLILEKEMKSAENAYTVLMQALHLQPRHAELMADAKRVAERAGQWDEFVKEVGKLELELGDSADSTQIALEMGRLCAGDSVRVEEAIAAFHKVLDRDPQNPEALGSLEEIYRKTERWEPLRGLYDKMLARDPRNPEVLAKLEDIYRKTAQNKKLVELLHKNLERDPGDGASFAKLEDIYRRDEQWKPLTELVERLLDRQPSNPEALAKLDELYRKTQSWKALASLLEQRAQRKDPEQARGLRMERATLLIDKLGDIEGALVVAQSLVGEDASAAEELYSRILDREPGNPVALAGLADLCRRKGEFQRAAKFALEGAEKSKNPLEQARLMAEAGVLQLDKLDGAEVAAELFARALAVDPEQMLAAERLAGLREARQDWAGLEPLLDLLLRKTAATDKTARAAWHERLAACARQLGKTDKALANYEAAAKLQPGSLAVARAIADLHFAREAWAEARSAYEDVRMLGGKSLNVAERAELCGRLAGTATRLGEGEAALRYHGEALELEPENRERLATLIELRAARQEWKEVVELKRRLVALCGDDDEKARAWEAIGDILREKLDDRTGAMNAYNEALAVQPTRRQSLYKTLDHYTADRQWQQAVDTLTRVAELESDPSVRAKCRYALAVIHRDELKDTAKALELFNQVLEDSPMLMRAFEAVERLMSEAKEWKELARAYRKQIKRLPAQAPLELKLRLWDGLAAVALEHLENPESASLAMEVASSLDRDNLARQEQLAQLYYEMGPSAADKAIAQHQLLIARKPDRIESYRALAALFFQAGAHDKMWCVAGAMTQMGKADPPLKTMYEGYRPTQLPNAAGKMTEELWRKILHPSEDSFIGALFALLSPAIAMTTAAAHKSIGVERAARVDLSGAAWPHAASLRYIANTIEAPLPDVFVKGDAPGSLSPVNLKEKNALTPALVVGSGFQWTAQSEIIFDLAKRLVLMRSERFPRFALGTPAALEIALRAGLALGGSSIGAGAHADEVDKMAKKLDGLLSPPLKAELKVLAKKFVEANGDKLDVSAWIVASDLTAARAALALSGDIVAAARVVAAEPSGQSPMPAQERVNDLLAFSVSEEHFAVRAALGLHVDLTPLKQAAAAAGPRRRMSHAQIKITP